MKKSIITIGIISLLIPISIKAGSVSLSCNDANVTKGGSTTCTLSGSSSEEVSALSAKLSSSGGVSISNVNISSGWQGDGSGGSIDLYTDNNKSGGFGIATFTVNVNGEGSISVGGVTFSDANFSENGVSGTSFNIGIKEEVKVEPPKETTTNNQPNTNSNTNSNPSNNNIEENTKEEKKSNDATLKELSLSNGTIDFNPNTLSYNVEVSNDIEKIEINAKPDNENANVKIPSDLSLKDGENKFIIEVTAQDGTKKEYEIKVVRLDKVLSNDSSLKSLDVAGYDIDFHTEKTVYDIGEIKSSSLKVYVVSNDSNATVRIHGNESIGKDDAIVIEVEAEDKSKTEYIIYVSNTEKEKSSSKILLPIIFVLLLVSLGFNGFFIYKNYNKKNR
ncbi:MAG: cadherin-like beta sandwich domain-containing protein [Bacilli bacterium]|nr:cadherin-like beta sandwich domain-containing protein [Bacilli bacterium]